MRAPAAVLILCLAPIAAQAKTTTRLPPVQEFNGDRWVRVSQAGTTAKDVTRAVRKPSHARKWRGRVPVPRPRRYPAPGVVKPIASHLGHDWATTGGQRPPSRFIGGRLICAANVNAALAARGIRGTGSALAKSFLNWGRPSGPVPGAVAVYNRGRDPRKGHAAIVAFVRNGVPYVWNPSRRGWRLQAYRKQAISYRVAG